MDEAIRKAESATSRINRKETLQIKDGMRKEVVRQLGIVKEVTAVEVRELARDKTAELYREAHSNPSQSMNPE